MEEWIPFPPSSPPPSSSSSSSPCSLCSIPYCSSGLVSSSLGEDKVRRQCSVIFLVRKLLKIPLPECEELLRNYGDPEEWMDLCPICTSILNEALYINDEINRMRRKVEELGEKLALPLHIKLEEEGEEEIDALPPPPPSSSSAARYIRRIVFNRGVLQRQPSTPLGNNEDNDDDNGVIIAPIAIIRPLFKTDSASGFTEEDEERNLSRLGHFLPLSPFQNFTAEVEGEEEDSESDNSKDEDYVFPKLKPTVESESEEEEEDEEKTELKVKVTTRKPREKPSVPRPQTKKKKKKKRTNTGNRDYSKGFPCQKCEKVMGTFTTLETHVRKIHYDENEKKTIFACPGCGECWYGDILKFQAHLGKPDCKIECKEKSIPCSQCHWRFENQTTLDLHVKIKHLATFARIVCSHCGKSFKSKGRAYYNHVKSHTEDISQICELCGKRSASLFYLRKHVAETHGNRNHKCDQCGQTFKRKTHLGRHQKLHTDVFPYLCTLCGKRFRMTNQLTVHMWSHDPERKEKYSTYKPKPKGYKPMREKRKRFRPTGGPPEEMQERQSSINKNKSTDSSTSTYYIT